MTMIRYVVAGYVVAGLMAARLVAWQSEGKSELQALAEQYQAGDARAKEMARERDRLALQAQSAIIGLKDAELQMERAISAAREICGKGGKTLTMGATGWACAMPPLVPPKPAGKDVEKK